MPTTVEVATGIYGAWRLIWLDRGALSYFDATVAGFWKSFFAAALVAPLYMLVVALDLTARGTDAGALRILIVHLCAYSISWTAFPLIMHYLTEAMDRRDRFILCIVALNWAEVIQAAVQLPLILLIAVEALPTAFMELLRVAVYMLILAYQWFVTRTTLDIGGFGAAGLVLLDVVIGLMVLGIASGMLR